MIRHFMETFSLITDPLWGNPLVKSGPSQQRTSNAKFWCFLQVDVEQAGAHVT